MGLRSKFMDGSDATEYQRMIAPLVLQAAIEDPGEDGEDAYARDHTRMDTSDLPGVLRDPAAGENPVRLDRSGHTT